jgi:primosomal protein N' (replication factor Y)
MSCLPPQPFAAPDATRAGPSLSADQESAAASLRQKVDTDGFSVTLLDGVTGSGKTEVYFEAVAAALKQGRQVLVLVPEIPLARQWQERFTERFDVAPAVWHSNLAQGKRRATWRAVAEHSAHVVVGARSALFLPFTNLGLIIVDEEHEAAYKQEEGVIYHARDMAVVRGREAACPVVLASATPSLETTVNVEEGRYDRVHLPNRHGGAIIPEIMAIDMRAQGPETGQWLSPPLREALVTTFAAGEQAILFLNRRGYAPLTLCRTCGHRFSCPNCTAWLVTHRAPKSLICHHCGYHLLPPEACPQCGVEDSLAACGPGVERLAEEAGGLFPDQRLAVMASDMPGGAEAAAEILTRMRNRKIDLLIGTQIIAKGHHFSGLTLVGVVDADLGLAGGDLRAGERTYQLLHQVAGRAGRESRPGKAYLQTYMPEHPVMEALVSGQRDAFLEAEAAQRRAFGLPPFGRLAAVIVSGRDAEAVEATARRLRRVAPQVNHQGSNGGNRVEILGPAPAPLTVLHGHTRWRLLLKAPRHVSVPGLMKAWLGAVKIPSHVRARIDIDPYSFL